LAHASPAYALVWVDLKEKTLNFVKNNKRPLNFTYLYNRSTLLWSSQREMIDFVFDRRSTTVLNEGWKPSEKGTNGFFTLKEHDMLTIPLGESPAKAKIVPLN